MPGRGRSSVVDGEAAERSPEREKNPAPENAAPAKPPRKTTRPPSASPDNRACSSKKEVRKIRNVSDFHTLYELGNEVMPSTHSYMKVHFALHKKERKEVVVKVRFKPECFRSKTDEKNWRRNTEFFMNIPEYCGVAALHDVIEDPKAFYIVMEKVDGKDLFETMEDEGRFGIASSREIIRQLLVAVAHLHKHCSVHKDLKLENVMLAAGPGKVSIDSLSKAEGGAVKVIDFDTLEEWTPHVRDSKDVVGTDQYIAQEAYAGKYSPLSDVFSVGVVAYRMLTNRFPFHDEIFDDEVGDNWVGSPKMAQIRRRLKMTKVDWEHRTFRDYPEAADLCGRMLAFDERCRPTAAVALEHAWFQDAPSLSSLAAAAKKGARKSVSSASPSNAPPVVVRPCWDEFIDDGIIIAEDLVPGKR